MPFFGIGIHILIALYFGIHAIRTGQQLYWLIILFSFPLLGSVVYFVAIYLPESRLPNTAKKTFSAVAKTLDPQRELREAKEAFDYTPTAQNQMRLALAQLEAGLAEEAANNYEACLKGPFAADLEIKFCAARAFVESKRYTAAIQHLSEIRQADAKFRAEQISILTAIALSGAGRIEEAKREFEHAEQDFGSFEVQAEFAIFALQQGDTKTAARLQTQIDKTVSRWNKHTRQLNALLLKRLDAAKK